MNKKKVIEALIKAVTKIEYSIKSINYYSYKDAPILLVEANRENKEYSFALLHNTTEQNDYYKAKIYHSFSLLSFRYPNTERCVIVLDEMKRKKEKIIVKSNTSNEVLIVFCISSKCII